MAMIMPEVEDLEILLKDFSREELDQLLQVVVILLMLEVCTSPDPPLACMHPCTLLEHMSCVVSTRAACSISIGGTLTAGGSLSIKRRLTATLESKPAAGICRAPVPSTPARSQPQTHRLR